MIRVLPAVGAPDDSTIADGFGRRTRGVDAEAGDEVEFLELPAALVEHSGFVTALAERVARFATVRHTSYAHIRRLDRPAADRLILVSDSTPGWRLSELLFVASHAQLPLDITVVIGILRQLLPAAALYGRHNRDSAIGALSPERLIVTPQARLVITEHAFGPALEKLNLGRDRLWRELRVAMPPSAGLPRANARADANALGVVALSLLLGRVLLKEEYPSQLQSLLEATTERHDGQVAPLSPALAAWLARALQFDVRTAFQSPHEAQVAFEAVLASDRGYVTQPAALEQWVSKVGGLIDAERNPPPPPPEPEPEAEAEAEPQAEEEPASAHEDDRDLRRDQPQAESSWAPPPQPHFEPPPPSPAPLPPPPVEVEAPVVAREVEPVEPEASASARTEPGELRRDPADLSAEVSATAEAASGREGGPEEPEAPYAPEAPSSKAGVRSPLVMALLAVAMFQSIVVIWLWNSNPGAPRAGEGELVVQSRPVAARVSIDGEDRGVTPLTLKLPAGAHVLEVGIGKSEPRVIPLTIQTGVQTAQYIELQNVPMTGGLDIRSDPPGARVSIDGQVRGTTPVTIRDLPPGDHDVVLEANGRKVRQPVRIDAGTTAQLVVPMPRR